MCYQNVRAVKNRPHHSPMGAIPAQGASLWWYGLGPPRPPPSLLAPFTVYMYYYWQMRFLEVADLAVLFWIMYPTTYLVGCIIQKRRGLFMTLACNPPYLKIFLPTVRSTYYEVRSNEQSFLTLGSSINQIVWFYF